MFLEEFTLTRTQTYMAPTRRGRFEGCTKSEAALWVSNPMHLGCKKPVSQPAPSLWPLMPVNTVHSSVQKAWGTQRGPDAL